MATADPTPAAKLRIDKWLWAARFYKTRALAVQAVEAGQVRLGGERVKPAHVLRTGDTVSVRKGGLVWDIEVIALSDRRGSAAISAQLYRETAESIAARIAELEQRKAAEQSQPRFSGRPTKRQRRKLEDFLNEP
jgi:ribosome-associated heat shock protein Hsp15